MKGEVSVPSAIFAPSGLNATALPMLMGSVAGSAYLVPNPDDHG